MRSPVRGFTLLELIVVIAIIGVLSVIIIPSFRTALDRANDTKLKQFAITLDKKNDIINKYDFEEGSGLLSKDSNVYQRNNLTLPGSGVTFSQNTYSSSSAYSLLFDGTSFVTSQNNLPVIDGKSFSVSVWVKKTQSDPLKKTLFGKYSGLNGLVFVFNNNIFAVERAGFVSCSLPYSSDTNWHHYVFSFNSNSNMGVIYVDSKKENQCNMGGVYVGNDTQPIILGPAINATYMDDLRFFDKDILSSEVQKLYAEGLSSGKFANR